MKILVAISVCVALCASSTVPSVPGDNSHYVEGVSRYVWMPDGDDIPRLVDLEEETEPIQAKSGARNEYWLYTRRNRQNHQVLRNNNRNSIQNSNFNGRLPIKVLVHGWNGSGNSKINPTVRDALLQVGDFNVIVLDWRHDAFGLYTDSARAVVGVGQNLGSFLNFLVSNFGANWNNIHLIGYSLGGHVVGNAGRSVGNRPGRITGLDPAGPRFRSNNPNSLRKSDARYVEVIHTDGDGFGIFNPIGDCDFYPNGGTNKQPGCSDSMCSHRRSYEFFAASVTHNHLSGRRCANLNEARNKRCNGAQHRMGNTDMSKSGQGLYGMITGSTSPF